MPYGTPVPVEERPALTREIEAKMRRLIDFRRPYDEQRSRFYRQYLGHRDPQTFPDGVTRRANTFAMIPKQHVEAIVSRVIAAYFSYDEWMEAKPVGILDTDAAEKMTLVERKLTNKGRLPQAFEDTVRTIAIYGHGGLKVDWDWGYDILNYKEIVYAQDELGQPIVDPMTGQPIPVGTRPATKPVPRNCPRYTPIDVYDLYVDPDKLTCAVVFDRTLGTLLKEIEGYKLSNPDAQEPLYYLEAIAAIQGRLAKEKNPESVIIRVAEIWDIAENTCALITVRDDDAVKWKEARASYRGANYQSFQRKVYGGPSELLWMGENQFNHKRIPIVHSGYVRLPNEVYGVGVIEPIAEMTEAMSQMINMIRDNWNIGINKRYAYDTNANIDHQALTRFNSPGGMVAIDGDPSKVLMPLPIHTPERGDYAIIQLFQGLVEATSGISDVLHQGVGEGGNNTASGISQVLGESNYRFKLFISNTMSELMLPILEMTASLIQQYLPGEIEVMITDEPEAIPKAIMVKPEELIGNFSFDLVAAGYVTNEVVKQRNLLAFANLAAQSPYVDQYQGLLELAKAFKIPNRNKILRDPQIVAQEQQQAQMQEIQMQEWMAEQEQRRQNEQIILSGAVNAHKEKQKARNAVNNKAGTRDKEGRPRSTQQEGPIPGVDIDSLMREVGQASNMGLRGLGSGAMGGS